MPTTQKDLLTKRVHIEAKINVEVVQVNSGLLQRLKGRIACHIGLAPGAFGVEGYYIGYPPSARRERKISCVWAKWRRRHITNIVWFRSWLVK